MARESFDKEIQFLRMLVLTSGAYSRQQFAERLGISVHTFDKTVKKLKAVVQTMQVELPEDQDKTFTDTFRFNYYDSAEPVLLFLFRAKSLKESESLRLSRILAGLNEQPLTIKELLEVCCSGEEQEEIWPDEKTLRGDLKYLEEVGVIMKQPGARPYRYRLYDDLIRQLSDDELCELFDFVDVMANTQVPSVQGYLMRDSLKKQLNRRNLADAAADPFLYKYHYYSRILDEAHLSPLLSAIRDRRKVQFLYFSPKEGKSYAARPTNPLFERDTEGRLEKMLPLKIVYDHQYGRWYLLASDKRKGFRKYRLEGITQITEAEAVDGEQFQSEKLRLEEILSLSWMIDTGNPVTIRARFINPVAGGGNNFVKERVLLQGQWGVITGEDEHSFIYEIKVNGYTEIKPWLRSFGSSCEILEPLQLRQEMIQEWKELLAYYESV